MRMMVKKNKKSLIHIPKEILYVFAEKKKKNKEEWKSLKKKNIRNQRRSLGGF